MVAKSKTIVSDIHYVLLLLTWSKKEKGKTILSVHHSATKRFYASQAAYFRSQRVKLSKLVDPDFVPDMIISAHQEEEMGASSVSGRYVFLTFCTFIRKAYLAAIKCGTSLLE